MYIRNFNSRPFPLLDNPPAVHANRSF